MWWRSLLSVALLAAFCGLLVYHLYELHRVTDQQTVVFRSLFSDLGAQVTQNQRTLEEARALIERNQQAIELNRLTAQEAALLAEENREVLEEIVTEGAVPTPAPAPTP